MELLSKMFLTLLQKKNVTKMKKQKTKKKERKRKRKKKWKRSNVEIVSFSYYQKSTCCKIIGAINLATIKCILNSNKISLLG